MTTTWPPPPDSSQRPGPSPVRARPVQLTVTSPPFVFAIAALALMLLGLLFPWISATAGFVGTISKNGIDSSDGQVIALAGVVGIVAVLKAVSRQEVGW